MAYTVEGPSFLAAADAKVPLSLEEMATESDIIALVTPQERLQDRWNSLENMVVARFLVRLDDILKGEVATGALIVAHSPGGEVKPNFQANGSRKPLPGDRSVTLEYADWPLPSGNSRAGVSQAVHG